MQGTTRERPTIDRIVCRWRGARCIDPSPELLHAPGADGTHTTAEARAKAQPKRPAGS